MHVVSLAHLISCVLLGHRSPSELEQYSPAVPRSSRWLLNWSLAPPLAWSLPQRSLQSSPQPIGRSYILSSPWSSSPWWLPARVPTYWFLLNLLGGLLEWFLVNFIPILNNMASGSHLGLLGFTSLALILASCSHFLGSILTLASVLPFVAGSHTGQKQSPQWMASIWSKSSSGKQTYCR